MFFLSLVIAIIALTFNLLLFGPKIYACVFYSAEVQRYVMRILTKRSYTPSSHQRFGKILRGKRSSYNVEAWLQTKMAHHVQDTCNVHKPRGCTCHVFFGCCTWKRACFLIKEHSRITRMHTLRRSALRNGREQRAHVERER